MPAKLAKLARRDPEAAVVLVARWLRREGFLPSEAREAARKLVLEVRHG